MTSFHELEVRIGIRFKHPHLLIEAFSHKTYSIERNTPSYERLEFLGDSLLNFIVGDYLFAQSDQEEGALTKMRADLVCEGSLKAAAEALGLGEFMLMGEELKKDEKFNVHSDDLYEALVGAIYLDGGLDAARAFVEDTLLNRQIGPKVDYKSRLQEAVQKKYRKNGVTYELKEIDPSALGDEDRFEATVFVLDRALATGRGRNKKTAESHAAKEALRKMNHGEV